MHSHSVGFFRSSSICCPTCLLLLLFSCLPAAAGAVCFGWLCGQLHARSLVLVGCLRYRLGTDLAMHIINCAAHVQPRHMGSKADVELTHSRRSASTQARQRMAAQQHVASLRHICFLVWQQLLQKNIGILLIYQQQLLHCSSCWLCTSCVSKLCTIYSYSSAPVPLLLLLLLLPLARP
jgi:hypothetical protein